MEMWWGGVKWSVWPMARMKEVRRMEMWWDGVRWSVWRMARMTAIEWVLVLAASVTVPEISLEKSSKT
jgi:hypothetical protein